ncbi:MAG: hypothetical protein CM15mP4_0110 [Candidatus Neomarinimicrobiota bacterium]|nr:MAG: hypothetical protein CM15mP4_0110 [Candidatus Neomarinimicrobiota bacterium]
MTGVLDHSQIELKVPWFKDKQPSSEEIVVWIWEQLEPNIAEGKLYKIRLVETHSIYTDYYGPNEKNVFKRGKLYIVLVGFSLF